MGITTRDMIIFLIMDGDYLNMLARENLGIPVGASLPIFMLNLSGTDIQTLAYLEIQSIKKSLSCRAK